MGEISREHEPAAPANVPRRIRWPRIGIGIATFLACVAFLYLVGINLFVGTRLFRNAISADPVAFRVEYERAYSVIPGRIHVEGLTIRGRDSNVEWILAVDQCDFRVAFLDLIHRRFRASHVRASDFTIRARLRIPASDATPELVAALPPIPGFADPPLAGPKPPPLTDANYHLWMVQLDDVDVQHVREVWIHTVRGQGDMRVRGRWLFRPVRWLEVGPALVDVATLDVSTGSRALATGLQGSIEATVHPFDVRRPEGLQVLEYMSTKMQLHGVAMTANVLTTILPPSEVSFTRAEGPVDVRLLVGHGVLLPGTRVSTESADTELAAAKVVFDASARIELEVAGAVASIHAIGSGCRVASDPMASADATSVEATIVSHHLDVAHAFDDATFAVDIHGAKTKKLAEWEAHFLPGASIAVRADLVAAECRLHGSLVEARGQGDLEFAARGFSATRGADKLTSDVTGHVALRDVWLAGRRADLSGSRISLQNAQATWHGVGIHAPGAALRATRALIKPGPPDVDFDLVVARADLRDLREIDALLPATAPFVMTGGRASISGRMLFSTSAQRAAGSATIVADDVSARVGPAIVAGNLVAHLALRRWGFADHAIELSDSEVVLRDVSVRGGLAAQRSTDILTVPALTIVTSRLAIAPTGNDGSVSLDVPSAAIVDLRTLAAVGVLPSDVCVEKGRIDASMHAETDLRSGSANGDGHVVARELRARFGATMVAAGLTVDVRARRAANEADERRGAESVDLSGSKVLITRGGIGREQGKWWGSFEMRDATLRTRDGVAGFQATVHGTATDASPATALLADNAGVPAWVANMFRMPELQVDGEVRATSSSFELRSMLAQGGGASVRLEYAKRGARREGAALMDLGWVEMGYDLTAGSSGLVVLGSEGWFDRKSAMIRANIPNAGAAEKQPTAESSGAPAGECVQ
jgi:hypothetical protein